MNYKETFIRLYNELNTATKELEIIQSQNPYDETFLLKDRILVIPMPDALEYGYDEEVEIVLEGHMDLNKYNITPNLIEANAERRLVMYYIELNLAYHRVENLIKMISSFKLSNDNAFAAWEEVKKFRKD